VAKLIFTDKVIDQVAAVQEGFMDFTCLIERATTTTPDDWNNDEPGDFETLPDRVVCSFKPALEEIDKATGQFVSVPARVKMPLGTDVRLTDRIVDLKDRHGNSVEPYRFEIKSITPRLGNLKLILQAVD